ncbi:Gfo/Idh/MocA family oxidoreductase [Clostridium weizhouense]|uniref:Gfo/Idh/MocA family oxidoreductase n=1 Tax=Clostridium weizhouense TaxID=2859781 RepID=A0ABS7ALR9_9CLOT|nr:Gfo/Idh/MocA family oxidoreductase [Clostridium weizhouense]MBW6409611.1 Gfo/Idh/MocA family oxidoreductase [Clostridium weizhouense]
MMSLERPLRVVVCGTRFGRVYLRGIEKLKDKFKLVGILARGSEQAAKCASEYNVPLYTSTEQLTKENVDIVCVVIRSAVLGGAGTNIADRLLSKGINVIQEHPVHYEDVLRCRKTARKFDAYYEVNSFYPNLKTVRRFIDVTRKVLKKSEAIYIDAACSMQVLYPLVDILGKALGGFRPWSFKLDNDNSEKNPFSSLSGEVNGIPINLRVMNQMNTTDPDNHTHLLHRIVIETTIGSVILTDSNGIVLWNPTMYVPQNEDGVLDLYGENEFLDFQVTELLLPIEKRSYRDVYNNLWPEGIAAMLEEFRDKILNLKTDNQLAQYELVACQVWKDIGEKLGPAKIIKGKNLYPVFLKDL